ncbi:MAG TPA: glyoxylate/hydroxypyruvate reductase A [Burkholderiaceae bacterium]|nr:glyoxylate/hydroxypyruvate reductase A [Burkholderiaceae bacterium]
MTVKAIVATQSADNTRRWCQAFRNAWPEARFDAWSESSPVPSGARYAIVWQPPSALFRNETALEAVFNLGAGVDSLLRLPELPRSLSIVRLEGAGMAEQMVEYVLYGLLRAAREFSNYAVSQADVRWQTRPAIRREDWPVGVMGLGTIGTEVAQAVARLGYPVAGWSRTARPVPGIEIFGGQENLAAFLARTRVLVNVLPLTPDTEDILNRDNLSRLLPDGYLINVARGRHLVEEDLLALLDGGRLMGAMLDVFRTEPLPADHPFWRHPGIVVTPHVAAITLQDDTVAQIVGKIRDMERGVAVSGVVNRGSGY